jgi:hypothetical protein
MYGEGNLKKKSKFSSQNPEEKTSGLKKLYSFISYCQSAPEALSLVFLLYAKSLLLNAGFWLLTP